MFDLLNHPKSTMDDLETCTGVAGKSLSKNAPEISLTRDMVLRVAKFLGDEEFLQPIVCSDPVNVSATAFGEQLSEQLARDGTKLFLIEFICFVCWNLQSPYLLGNCKRDSYHSLHFWNSSWYCYRNLKLVLSTSSFWHLSALCFWSDAYNKALN